MSQMILHPGEYFIELEFDRPVDPAVLHRALTSMGFGVVVFDQSIPSVEVGALSLAAVATKATSSALTALKPAIAPIQSRYVAPAVVAAPKSVATVAPIMAAVAKPALSLATSAAARLADGGSPTALKSSTASAALSAFAKPSLKSPLTKPGLTPAGISAAVSKGPSLTGPAKPGGFPGDVLPPPSADPYTPPGPYTPPAEDGGGGGGEPKGEFKAPEPVYEPAEAAPPPPPAPEASPPAPSPEPQAAVASPEPQAPALSSREPERDPKKLTELWTKWKEWGSPFASGPNVSGGGGDDDPLRFRVLARLDRPISLDDRPGMRWLFVKALSIPFLSDLVFQAHPHTLRQGSLYELRFLSRAKSNRTRDSVKQELTQMGWKPIKLSAIKRNMTLPRRPASLTLWYGMAVWNHADSVIVNDDPFFFETVKEIRSQ